MAENGNPRNVKDSGQTSGAASTGRRHVGSTADPVQSTPIIQQSKLSATPSITPTAQPKKKPSFKAKSHAQVKPEAGKEAAPEAPRSAAEPGMIVVRLKQETLVLGGLVACSLLLGAFIFGHKVGKFRGRQEEISNRRSQRIAKPSDDAPRTRPSGGATVNRTIQIGGGQRQSPTPAQPTGQQTTHVQADVWTLCVISYAATHEDKAQALKTIMSEAIPDHRVYIKKSGSKRTVCVGHFRSPQDPGLTQLRDAIRQMTYEGKRQFKDCYQAKL